MALPSFPPSPFCFTSSSKPHHLLPTLRRQRSLLALPGRKSILFLARSTNESAAAAAAAAAAVEEALAKKEEALPPPPPLELEEKKPAILVSGDSPPVEAQVVRFKDPRWIGGTWDLKQFSRDGRTDWDAVIHAEARRRKWLEDCPEASSNDEPVLFDTSIIPWWAWINTFHLPEAEKLNGRAAMIGFFMAYFVDSLTGMGLVDQMGNFFCKTLLLLAVVWVLLIRENKDIENLKKLFEETTLYDRQWRATWQDDASKDSKK